MFYKSVWLLLKINLHALWGFFFMSVYIFIIGISNIRMCFKLQIDSNVHDCLISLNQWQTLTLLYIHSECIHTLYKAHTFSVLDNSVNNMQYSHSFLCTLVLSVKVSLMLRLTYANTGKTQRCFVLVADCTLWETAFFTSSSR